MTHTKGPWEATQCRGLTLYVCDAEVHDFVICEVETCNPDDARLIAAAPELLTLAELVHGSFGGGHVITFSDQDIAEFAAAIAKARGET